MMNGRTSLSDARASASTGAEQPLHHELVAAVPDDARDPFRHLVGGATVIVGDDDRGEPDAGCVEPRLSREHAHVDDRGSCGAARLVEHLAQDARRDAQTLVGKDRRARRDRHGWHQVAPRDCAEERGCSTSGLGQVDVRIRPVSSHDLRELHQLDRRVGVQVEAERDR